MKKILLPALLLFIAIVTRANSPEGFWDSPDAYLGQVQPGEIPVKFAPNLLADSLGFSASKVAFTRDGKEFYYCYNRTWANNDYLKIKYFKYQNGAWKGPFTINEHRNSPVLSPDEKTLYFVGRGARAWQSHRTANGWSEPTTFFEQHVMYGLVPTNSGIIYTGSNEFVGAEQKPCNLDVSTISITGTDTVFHSLGVPVNSPGWNGDFFVSSDESFIIISTKESDGGNCELYLSYRKPDKTWTNPKSLGPIINNDVAHRYGQYVTNDKKFLFYCYAHTEKDCAVYWVRFDHLYDSLKHTNFEPYVLDSVKDQSIVAGKTFSIPVPSKIFVDDDGANTLTYTATLSDGSSLPAWLHFDTAKQNIYGEAPVAGTYNITIIATDNAKAQAASSFTLAVKEN